MKKILILSSFPAPYRVAVFKGLAEYYEEDVFFGEVKDQDRSKDFFVDKSEFNYYVLTDSEAQKKFELCKNNLKQYDLVLAYDWYLSYALKIELQCVLQGVPYIVNCDGAFIEPSKGVKGKIKDFVKSFFIKRAAYCFSSGKYATEYFKHYGAKVKNITEHHFTSLNEDDIIKEPLTVKEKDNIKQELGLSKRKCVVAIGQYIYRKGFDVLLNAWKKFDENYQLVIIGGGTLENEYQSIIAQNKYKRVELLNFVPKNIVMKYLSAADLFVLPTREDIWGLVVNEALAVGTSVITTNRCIAGLELIQNGKNGYIVENEDVEELVDKMRIILSMDEKEAAMLSKCAIESIKDFTLENVVLHHKEYIDTVLNKA